VLDAHTRARCHHVQQYAEREGYDLFETLEAAGLLVSEDKRALISQLTVLAAVMQLEDQQHTTLAHLGGGQTVTGAVLGCVKFLNMFAKSLVR
jgi:hypothetical protein